MLNKIFLSFLFLITLSHSIEITTDKKKYTIDEEVKVSFIGFDGKSSEWLAIYPINSNNDFVHIVEWQLSGADANGTVNFTAYREGTYNVRAFIGAEMVGTSNPITISEEPVAQVETTKDIYQLGESIEIIFEDTKDQNGDWVGIYPKDTNNDWNNIVNWAWLSGGTSGIINFDSIPLGEYEVRIFFRNSFEMEAYTTFSVESPEVELSLNKRVYTPFELINVKFEKMRGLEGDWIGLFAVGANDGKEEAIQWLDSQSLVSGNLSFNGVEVGEYEIRAYFDNVQQKSIAFRVTNQDIIRILYDDFEDGIDPRWTKYFGRDMTLLNVGVTDQAVGHTQRQIVQAGQHSLRTYNSDGLAQSSGYFFNFENPDKKFKFLEVDMRVGESSHRFAFGVKIKTVNGDRRIEFASWLNHTLLDGQQIIQGPYGNVVENHRQAFTQDGYLHVHPAPSDYFVGTTHEERFNNVDPMPNSFIHYKIDIEKALKILEPENEFLGMIYFGTSGGDYDNLALSTN